MSLVRPLAVLSLSIGVTAGCTSFLDAVKDDPIQPDPYETSVGTDIDDFQISTAIGVNIRKAHPLLDNAHVNVHSFNGVILLTGEVVSNEMRTLAGDTARNFRGVRQVHNELQIQGRSSFFSRTNDGWIATKVRSKLLAEKNVDSGKIKVITENAVVYLMGTVPPAMAETATKLASTTKGVRKVVKAFEYPEVATPPPSSGGAAPATPYPAGATAYPDGAAPSPESAAPYPESAAPYPESTAPY